MKTKIIYISGNEIFDMQDIQAAFNQVRAALNLGPDTVMFGVPVDRADALGNDIIPSASVIPTVDATVIQDANPVIETQIIDDTPTTTPDVVDNDITDIVDAEPTPIVVAAPQKKSRGRPKSAKKVEEPIAETAADKIDTPQDTGKVVSILSVLTSKQEDKTESDSPAPLDTDIIDTPTDDTNETVDDEYVDGTILDIDAIDLESPIETVAPADETDTVSDELPADDNATDIIADDDISEQSIDDMITDDAPVTVAVAEEKTLEQLLESMTPLREDIEHEQQAAAIDSGDEIDLDTSNDAIDITADDDATLEQLATEFAENQDKIATMPKTENHGKIGKLKNILPFKKARRDDSGLMGDLFGWAGIAANDEDFAIPGFFTNAASKK